MNIEEIGSPLLTASGLSDKALNYFTEDDKIKAIKEFIYKFLNPAGENFIDEAVYRYLINTRKQSRRCGLCLTKH